MSYTNRLEESVRQAESASDIARQWANGPANTTVATESGQLPTIAEFLRQKGAQIDANAANIAAFQSSLAAANSTELVGGTAAAKVGGFISKTDVLADGRAAINKLTVGNEVLTAPTIRDDVVVGKTITTLTDSHAFADRTIISTFTDAGTYGTFDATTQYAHTSGTANHLYTFQGRGKKTGAGNLDNYASFYSQPNLSGGTVTDMHHVRVYDNAGNSTVTNQHGVHIRPLTQGVNNYAIFSWGDTPSIHVGKFTVGVSTIDNTAAIAAVNKANMTGIRQYGFKSDCGANSAALTDYAAYYARVNTSGTGYTLPYGSGLVVEDANLSAGTTIGAAYGFWIKDQTKGTVNAAMRLDVTKATNKWNLYATGDADNYLKGNLGMGVFQPTARIECAASPAGSPIAPIKLTAGTLLATPQNGALEFDGTNLYFTVGGVRKIVNLT